MKLKLKRPLAFFDIESTGVQVTKDRIIELAILKLFPDGSKEEKVFVINPGIPIPPGSTEFHGFTDDMVKDKPHFKDVAPEIQEFLINTDLAGYNSNRFDIPMLVEEFLRADMLFDTRHRKFLDVFQIFVKKEKRDLSAAYKFYCGKDLENAHSASADINATFDVMMAQLDKYDELEGNVDFLHNFSKDGDFVDLGRRMVYINGEPHFNFGKYKGKKVVDALEHDPHYYKWIMESDFLSDTKQKLKEIKLMHKHKR
jgi:DNA polymerase III subunit epsilon